MDGQHLVQASEVEQVQQGWIEARQVQDTAQGCRRPVRQQQGGEPGGVAELQIGAVQQDHRPRGGQTLLDRLGQPDGVALVQVTPKAYQHRARIHLLNIQPHHGRTS